MSNFTILCGVCSLRHISRPSTVWCLNCEEGLCPDCKEPHTISLLKATRNHSIIPITEYQKIPQNVSEITQNCIKHHEIIQTVCIKHDFPCCRKCIIQTHNNCKDLVEIENYIKDIKSSTRFSQLKEMLNETDENIRRISINRQENLTSLQEARKKIENDIIQIRIKINDHLDKLQADLIQNLYAKVEKENEKIQEVLISLEEKQCQIKEYQNAFENIKKYASDIQLFLSMKTMETNMLKNEQFIQSLIESNSIYQVTLYLMNNINMETITVSMPYIGKVEVYNSPSQVRIAKMKEKQAQIMATIPTTRAYEKIVCNFQKKIITCGGGLTGCTHLPNGKIAFASEIEKSINVVNSDGSLDCKIDLQPYKPFDVTYIPDNETIAVTFYCLHSVKLIDVHTKQTLKDLRVGSPSYGIAYTKGRLVVWSREKGLIELNPHDGSIQTIVSERIDVQAYVHVATTEDKIYTTNYSRKSVKCYDFQGTLQWAFEKSNLIGPLGVTVDDGGNVFVADNQSHSVIFISQNGQQYRELLSSENGIRSPHGVIYDRQTNQLLVTNYSLGALLYNVT